MLEIGSIIDGKYKILNKIGQGGMSVVYLAMNERANKPWAIKEVRKDGGSNFEVVKQNLIAETDILKRLNHPHLPSIIDVIDMEDTFLIVMDYIEGKPLSDALKREGAQPQEKVIEWAKQICDVLGYLHSRKPPIIYRDMKPSNVMLKPDGNIMIIDFGTAREYKTAGLADTTCLGTQGYAAPEQFGGYGQTDARTDIYCLGATLYHLVTGHNPCLPPFEMYPIRQWNPALSSGLEDIILKCTQKNPDDRYQSCAELMYALEHHDELNHEFKKKQNRKWKTFMATSVLTVASLVAAVGFKVAENRTTSQSYDSYIHNAASAGTIAEKIDNYENAIRLNPGDSGAYISLLNAMIDDDGNFSQTEAARMTSILGYKGENNKSNESYLAGDKAGYDEFSYAMGRAYYFYYETDGNPQLSQVWFEQAGESTTLDSQKVKRAQIFAKIAGYYSTLSNGIVDKTGDSSVTYRDYWNDMMLLLDGQNVTDADNSTIAIEIYKNVVHQVYVNAVKFKTAGVTKDELTNELENIKGYVSELGNADGAQETLSWVDRALQSVETTYSTSEANLTNTSGGSEDAGTAAAD